MQVGDLAAASPATVSRCGMVYLDASQIGWRPLTLSWLRTLPAHMPKAVKDHLLGLCDWLVPVCLRFVRREVKEATPTLPGTLIVGYVCLPFTAGLCCNKCLLLSAFSVGVEVSLPAAGTC